MTLEQTTERTLAAAELQDLAALEMARVLRESAIAALASSSPTQELCQKVAASIAAGEQAKQAIHAIRRRIRNESRRLALIENGFLRAQRAPQQHQIDCRA